MSEDGAMDAELEALASGECPCCMGAAFQDRGDGFCRTCPHEKGFHGWTRAEADAWAAWAATEPGLRHRLKLREDRLGRFLDLDAGPVLVANAVRHVNEIRAQLGIELLPEVEVPE